MRRSSVHIGYAIATLALVAASCGGSGSTGGSEPVSTTSGGTGSGPSTTTLAPEGPPETVRGFTLSPLSYEAEDFGQFIDLVSASADVLGWAGDAAELEREGSPAEVVHALADQHGLEPLVVTGVSSTETGQLLRPLDEATFDGYVATAAAYAREYRPRFLGYGVEIDTMFHAAPEDFDRFVELFAAVAEAVHEESPETLVIVGFQLERLRGLNGGLFGGVNDEQSARWDLIDLFPDADVIGFSTYPGLVFEHPDDIPDDYYRVLAEHTDGRPVAFTEMGWQAGGDLGPYSGSAEAQARFVERFPTLVDGLDLAFYLWAFLFDQPTVVPFDTMGLWSADGTARPGWDVWTEQ